MEQSNIKTDSQDTASGIFKVLKKVGFATKKVWSEDEDKLLLRVVAQFGNSTIKWKEVASKVNKTSKQCYSRYRQINPCLNKGFWTKQEEETLKQLVAKHGKKWAYIAKIMKTRSGKQIRHHYLNILDENNKKKAFTIEEDELLKELFLKFGPRWQIISKYFEGRTGDTIKSRYYNKIKNIIEAEICNNAPKTIKKDYSSQFQFNGITNTSTTAEVKSESINSLFKPVSVKNESNQNINLDYISNLLKQNNIKDDNRSFNNYFGMSGGGNSAFNDNLLFRDPFINNSNSSFNSIPFINNHELINQEFLFRDVIMRSIQNIQNYQNFQLQQSLKSQSLNNMGQQFRPDNNFNFPVPKVEEDKRVDGKMSDFVMKSAELLSYLNIYDGQRECEDLNKYFDKDKVKENNFQRNNQTELANNCYPQNYNGSKFPVQDRLGLFTRTTQNNNSQGDTKGSANLYRSTEKDPAYGFWKKESQISQQEPEHDRNSSSDNSSY